MGKGGILGLENQVPQYILLEYFLRHRGRLLVLLLLFVVNDTALRVINQ